MYNLKSNNSLSGLLTIPLNVNQSLFMQLQRVNIEPYGNQPDGLVTIYDGRTPRAILDYKDIPVNGVQGPERDIFAFLGGNFEQRTIAKISFGTNIKNVYKAKNNNAYIDVGFASPLLVKLVDIINNGPLRPLPPPIKDTPPPINNFPYGTNPTAGGGTTNTPNYTTTTEPDCPCDCDKQIVSEKIYINPTRTDATDTPVRIKVQKRVCTSKDNEKKYIFDCDTSIAEINRQLNSGLNGLADCPCDCIDQLVEQTYYISSRPMQGSIPFVVNTEKIVCNDTNEILNRKIDCEELKASLRARGFTTLADNFDCMLSNGGLRDAISDDNIFTKNDYLIPKLTATFVGIFAVSRYLMK